MVGCIEMLFRNIIQFGLQALLYFILKALFYLIRTEVEIQT
jgi:hypothetical protein